MMNNPFSAKEKAQTQFEQRTNIFFTKRDKSNDSYHETKYLRLVPLVDFDFVFSYSSVSAWADREKFEEAKQNFLFPEEERRPLKFTVIDPDNGEDVTEIHLGKWLIDNQSEYENKLTVPFTKDKFTDTFFRLEKSWIFPAYVEESTNSEIPTGKPALITFSKASVYSQFKALANNGFKGRMFEMVADPSVKKGPVGHYTISPIKSVDETTTFLMRQKAKEMWATLGDKKEQLEEIVGTDLEKEIFEKLYSDPQTRKMMLRENEDAFLKAVGEFEYPKIDYNPYAIMPWIPYVEIVEKLQRYGIELPVTEESTEFFAEVDQYIENLRAKQHIENE